jgi:hypothetical protein
MTLSAARMGLLLAVAFCVFCFSVHANPITYQWQGNNGFTGSFTLDTSAFTPGLAFDLVPQTALTDFSFSGPGFTFNVSEVVLSSSILFNTTFTPPHYSNGAGTAAMDPAGDTLAFFPTAMDFTPAVGITLQSTGTFLVATPEPETWGVVSMGLIALALVRFKRAFVKN